MDYKFFESLSKNATQSYLAEFLCFGEGRGIEILEEKLKFTTDIDFNIKSLFPVFKSLLPTLIIIPKEPDLTLPEFVRNTEIYKKNLFDFDESSKSILLASAYYLGETFVRNFEQLSWSTGDTNYIQGNMPVVTGFKLNKELAPILIVENIFGGVLTGTNDELSINIAIEAWVDNISN